MKVLLLNTFNEVGGAAKAATRLNGGLRSCGIDAQLLVQSKTGDAKGVIEADISFAKSFRSLRPHLDALPVRLYPHRKGMYFSPSFLPDSLVTQVNELNPDIIHLHWLAGGFMRLESLPRFKKPLLWTLHDSWAFTGGCQLPFDCTRYRESCGKCPVLGSKSEHDLSRWVWHRKQTSWHTLNLTVVAPSNWLAECARSSSLLRSVRIEVIPNGLDLSLYKPFDRRAARELFSLPLDKQLILFGANLSTSDRNKGFDLLASALRNLADQGWRDKAEVVIFGAQEPGSTPDLGLSCRYLGWLKDEVSISRLYSAADVCVIPSIQENLPYAAMEALACGTPCVAFRQGGMPDLIDDGITGFLARPYECGDLAQAIARVLEHDEHRMEMADRSRRKAEQEYALEKIAARYGALYREICAPHQKRTEENAVMDKRI